jgi:hypothetical protein
MVDAMPVLAQAFGDEARGMGIVLDQQDAHACSSTGKRIPRRRVPTGQAA